MLNTNYEISNMHQLTLENWCEMSFSWSEMVGMTWLLWEKLPLVTDEPRVYIPSSYYMLSGSQLERGLEDKASLEHVAHVRAETLDAVS